MRLEMVYGIKYNVEDEFVRIESTRYYNTKRMIIIQIMRPKFY